MSKQKGSKTFMTLSQKECLIISNDLIENALSFYNDAELLARTKFYGRATSMLIHSTEEMMKAFILFLDGNGFQFRKNINGINNLFTNHSLRYSLAMVLSVLQIFSDDLNSFLQITKNDSNKLNFETTTLENKFWEYLKNKIKVVRLEIIWFSEAEFLRQKGLYVDYVDRLNTPLEINEKDYNEVLVRVKGLNSFVLKIIDCFESNEDVFNHHLEKLKIQFLNKCWYQIIGDIIQRIKAKKTNSLVNLSSLVESFIIEIESIQIKKTSKSIL